jgi:hypothetical protein
MILEYVLAQALSPTASTLSPLPSDAWRKWAVIPYMSCARGDGRVASVLSAWDKLRAVISEIGQLPENWDGHGAASISSEATGQALRLLEQLARLPFFAPPDVTPIASGTIGFTWESGISEVYVEIGKTRCSGYFSRGYGEPILFEGAMDQIEDEIVGSLVASQPESAATKPVFATLVTRMNEFDAPLAA